MVADMVNYDIKIGKFGFCRSQVSKEDLLFFSYETASAYYTFDLNLIQIKYMLP